MPRFSIFGNPDRFEKAVVDVHKLISEGHPEAEIIKTLASKYQEREIARLLEYYKRYQQPSDDKHLQLGLKIALWYLFITKLLATLAYQFNPELTVVDRILVLFLGPLLNAILLILAYRKSPNRFIWIFALLAFGATGSVDVFEDLWEFPLFSVDWIFSFLAVCALITAMVLSFKLHKKYPAGYVLFVEKMKELNLA